jgi:hypothetical protein
MLRLIVIALISLLSITRSPVGAELDLPIHGRIDIGPTLLSVDILESGKTIETLHMKGIKGDATILVWKGLCIKPSFLWGTGDGELANFSIGIGHYIPINDDLLLVPSVGVTFSKLHTKVDFEEFGLFDLKEKFRSISPYIGLEFCYKIIEKWYLLGMVQYAWSRTHTTIDPIVSDKSKSVGPNYSLAIEYNFIKDWAVTLGVGYNLSLTKEKHGIRGKGIKLGLAYYF